MDPAVLPALLLAEVVLSPFADPGTQHEPPALHGRGSVRLWLALATPPLVWFAAQNAGYFFVSWACARTNGEWMLHAIAVVSILLCLGAGLLSWAVLRDVGHRGNDDHDDRIQRTRFLGRLGIAGAIIFSLILIVQWIAIAIHDPCMPYPRSRFTPDALNGGTEVRLG
jgi:hypothetical protein